MERGPRLLSKMVMGRKVLTSTMSVWWKKSWGMGRAGEALFEINGMG
jgi:hypothetical protein